MTIEFRDPPDGPPRMPPVLDLIEALNRRPGQWAAVWPAPTNNAARNAKRRLLKRLGPVADRYEVIARGKDVYARAV